MKLISYTTLTILTVDLLATSGDITMTWTSPMYSKLYSTDPSVNPLSRPITADQDALIGSLINIGAILGGLPFSVASDYFGRKIPLLVIGSLHVIAYLSMAFAKSVGIFYFGRILGGIAVGGGYTILPMYIAEVAEEPKRGLYSMTLTIFWAFGNFLPYLIGHFLSVKVFNLCMATIPIIFCILFLIIGTETPFYLVGANKIEEAEKVLMLLRSEDEIGIQKELKHIRATLDQEEEEEETSGNIIKNILINRGIRKGFIISILLIVFQQLSGWNAVTMYLQPIFDSSDTELPSYLSSLVIGASIFIFSLSAPYVADKYGRKTLLIYSSAIMGLCLAMLGTFFCIKNRTDINIKLFSWLPITSLLLFVLAFENGLACVPWTVSSELFPKNVKKISASVTSAACFIASFLITQFFNDMTDADRGLGMDGTFFMYSGCTFLCILFIVFYVPETRGKTFAEIQILLQK